MVDKRRRGAQTGNHNAFKHGFYARTFKDLETRDLDSMLASGLADEIAMLRVITRRTLDLANGIEDLDTATKVLAVMGTASTRLAGLLRTQKLLGTDRSDTARAISEALADVIAELGIQ